MAVASVTVFTFTAEFFAVMVLACDGLSFENCSPYPTSRGPEQQVASALPVTALAP
jgi:hypothetical protein